MPTRALRQLSEYGIGLSPNEPNPENAVKDLVSFLPVLAYDGANMTQIDVGGILEIAMTGTSTTERCQGLPLLLLEWLFVTSFGGKYRWADVEDGLQEIRRQERPQP